MVNMFLLEKLILTIMFFFFVMMISQAQTTKGEVSDKNLLFASNAELRTIAINKSISTAATVLVERGKKYIEESKTGKEAVLNKTLLAEEEIIFSESPAIKNEDEYPSPNDK